MPASRVGYRRVSAAPVPTHVTEAYAKRIRQLLDATTAPDGEPARIRLSPEALAVRDALAGRLEARMRPGADLAHVKDWAGKAAGLAVRLAGVMHLAASSVGAIGEATMQAAVTIAEAYALPHALAAFGEMGADPELDAALALVEWIESRGLDKLTVRDAHRGLGGQVRFRRVEAVQRAFDLAEKHGHVERLPDPPRTGPGHPPSPRYEVTNRDTSTGRQNRQNRHNGPPGGRSVNPVDIVKVGDADAEAGPAPAHDAAEPDDLAAEEVAL
jgi:hypothetical protein